MYKCKTILSFSIFFPNFFTSFLLFRKKKHIKKKQKHKKLKKKKPISISQSLCLFIFLLILIKGKEPPLYILHRGTPLPPPKLRINTIYHQILINCFLFQLCFALFQSVTSDHRSSSLPPPCLHRHHYMVHSLYHIYARLLFVVSAFSCTSHIYEIFRREENIENTKSKKLSLVLIRSPFLHVIVY